MLVKRLEDGVGSHERVTPTGANVNRIMTVAAIAPDCDDGQRTTSILVVDDDEVLRDRLARAFRDRGLDVEAADGFQQAAQIVAAKSFDRAVVDLRMPGPSGLDLLKEIKRVSPDTEVVLLTGFGSISNAVEAIQAGAVNYIPKPADADEILAAFPNHHDSGKGHGAREHDYRPPTLAKAEWEHIHKILSQCDGNITEASRLLGIPRRSLQRKLKKLSPE